MKIKLRPTPTSHLLAGGRRNACLLMAAACTPLLLWPAHSFAVVWNATDPGSSAVSLNGLSDNYDQFVDESVIYNADGSTRGTATYLGNGWALTARHVIQNGGDYNTLAPTSSISLNVYGTTYTADQFVAFGSSDIALVHFANSTSGTITNLPGVQRTQIYTGSSEQGNLVQIGGFGYWGAIGGTESTSTAFYRAFNTASIVSGTLHIYANANTKLINDNYLLGVDESGDSGSAMWMDNGADQDLDLRDWSVIGVTDTSTGNFFGADGGYARVTNYASTIISTVFPHSALTWNANTTTATAVDGPGTWNLTTARFTDGTNYTFNGPMQTQTVTFGAGNGTAGTVTLGANIPVDSIIFNAAGSGSYTIAGSGSYAILLTAGSDITTNVDATISAPMRGGSTTQYGGDAEVTKDGPANLTLTGITNLDSGVPLRIRAGGVIVDTGGAVIINSSTAAVGWYTGDTATLTVRGTGSFTNLGEMDLGYVSGTGTLNVQASAILNLGSLYVGKGSTGITGTAGNGTVNHSSGNVTANSVSLATLNAASIGTYNLAGGILTAGSVTGGVGNSTFNFLGGTLRAKASSSSFMQNLTAATIGNSAAVIDTNSNSISINQPLSHSASASTLDGGLTKIGYGTLTLGGANTYTGPTTISAGLVRLDPTAAATAAAIQPVADYSFDSVSNGTVLNTGTGGSAMNGVLTNGATIVSGGRFGNAVSLSGGADVTIPSSIADLGGKSAWTINAWVKTSTPGSTILTKSDGGWTYDNTIFYLGDGTGAGSGSLPSSVRYGRGFVQAAPGSTAVTDNAWHLISYVSTGASFAIYTDGQLDSLSSGNSSFVPSYDVGGTVLLGATTDTTASDGTVNFNGLLDEVSIYSKALSAAQIQALFASNSPNPAPVSSVLPATTPLIIASGATLDLNNYSQTVGSLAGPVGASLTLGNGTLTTGNATTTEFDGVITGAGSLIKNGNGTLALGNANTYTGTTLINTGTLLVTNNSGSATGSGNVTLNQATLGGNGTLTGTLLLGTGPHTLAPGIAGTGTLTLGGLTTDPQTTLAFSLTSAEKGSTPSINTALNISGNNTLALNGGTLQVTLPAITPATLGYYPLIQYTGTYTGSLASLTLPPSPTPSGHFLYTLDTLHDPGSIDLHLGLLGDANDDGTIDLTDLNIILNNLGTLTPSWSNGNFDSAPTIDLTDLNDVLNNLGTSYATTNTAVLTTPVPEPASLLLLTLALPLLHRRKSRHPKV